MKAFKAQTFRSGGGRRKVDTFWETVSIIGGPGREITSVNH